MSRSDSSLNGHKLVELRLAGDSLLPTANSISTQSIRIDTKPEQVWPWLIQMGQDRGGFYSYSTLENLVGCKMNNADKIHPEWQDLKLGDQVSMHPRAPKLSVVHLLEPKEMVLMQTQSFKWSWSFNLFPFERKCDLVVRTRIAWKRAWTRVVLGTAMKWGHHIMEKKMLIGIKRRAESDSREES